ncbi:SgcJ/EcaC family oxidoreductase [Pseudomonas chlororaphis]|uniref:YybH family protein n=1 Tax=Pseudomonas chlororaphis TaxID=587753 RepID=UPI0012327CF8|nr:SgcJ/EcaC family oxidoreductase [Pseudomonas chlororaphis]KAA5840713.1 SgcJ/EcaC family oxidoreductase [Pseudomonas chlororaphis]
MRIPLITLMLGSLLLPLTAQAAKPGTEAGVTAAVTQQLKRYETALNTSDLDQVMTLYAGDAVFMPQNSLPAVGRDAVRAAYRQVFDLIRLDVRFTIDEIQPLSRDWAFARTRSNGTVKLLKADQPASAEGNQEVFLLHRESDGQWRFARYIFSATQPRQ